MRSMIREKAPFAMIRIIQIPVRILVFSAGLLAHWMEVAADWLVGARDRTEYVRTGYCKRCGRCCRCLSLIMPKGMTKRHWMARLARLWHEFAMNFRFISEEENWLVYRCGYFCDDRGDVPGHCSIYPFRHRLCRFFPRQGLYGHPSLHPDCGYGFVRRDVWERRRDVIRQGGQIFDDVLRRAQK